jgi:aminoglycoside phosphotransferase (APT) family kinase protein
MTTGSGLPVGMLDWVAEVAGGPVVRHERHVARREAWVVDAERPDGSLLKGFLRLEREPKPGNPWSLEKEAAIVTALGPTPVPVTQVYGWNADLSCALFERVDGIGEIASAAPENRRTIMEQFIDGIAAMHRLDLDALDLPDLAGLRRPSTARECALAEVETIVATWSDFLASYTDPLITYGLDWLRRNAPERVSRISLLQGDTGPGNFVFDGDRLTAIVDFEWGHFGDPLEDLGNLCVREFWTPSGCLDAALLARYEKASGIPVNLDAVRYYRVQQNVRGMIPIHATTRHARAQEPLAWYLAYQYVGDRATCDAIAESMGITLTDPELPAEGELGILAQAVDHALGVDVRSSVQDGFARSRLADAQRMVACIDRLRRYEPAITELERDALADLLGHRPETVADGLTEVDAGIKAGRFRDEEVLPYLAGRCRRLEWLYKPASDMFPDRTWARLD